MGSGYGFAGEGDWKDSRPVRAMKVMGAVLREAIHSWKTIPYHFNPENNLVLGSHMLEICESIADGKASCEIHPLGIGGKADPVRLVFNSAAGPAINASIIDMGNRFRLLVNEVVAVARSKACPNCPSPGSCGSPIPTLKTGCTAWIYAGGAHHTCYSQNLTAEHLQDFADMAGIELALIGKKNRSPSVP